MKKRIPDDRAMFANAVCRLIYQQNNGDLDKCVSQISPFYGYFEEHVRNVYELIDSQIPMFFLFELSKPNAIKDRDYDSEDDFLNTVKEAKAACHEYYS